MKRFHFHLSTLCIWTVVLGVLIYPLVFYFSAYGNHWECLGQYRIVTADGRTRTVEVMQLVPMTIPGEGFRIKVWAGHQVVYDNHIPFRFGTQEVRVSEDERKLYLFSQAPHAEVIVLEERQGRLYRVSTIPREAEELLAQLACVNQLTRWTHWSGDDEFVKYGESFRLDAISRLALLDRWESRTVETLRKVIAQDSSERVKLAATQLLADRRRH